MGHTQTLREWRGRGRGTGGQCGGQGRSLPKREGGGGPRAVVTGHVFPDQALRQHRSELSARPPAGLLHLLVHGPSVDTAVQALGGPGPSAPNTKGWRARGTGHRGPHLRALPYHSGGHAHSPCLKMGAAPSALKPNAPRDGAVAAPPSQTSRSPKSGEGPVLSAALFGEGAIPPTPNPAPHANRWGALPAKPLPFVDSPQSPSQGSITSRRLGPILRTEWVPYRAILSRGTGIDEWVGAGRVGCAYARVPGAQTGATSGCAIQGPAPVAPHGTRPPTFPPAPPSARQPRRGWGLLHPPPPAVSSGQEAGTGGGGWMGRMGNAHRVTGAPVDLGSAWVSHGAHASTHWQAVG